MTRCALSFAVVLAALAAACGSTDTPTSPSGGAGTGSSVSSLRRVPILFSYVGTFTAAFEGRSMNTTGPFDFDLRPGTYELSGTLTGGLFGTILQIAFVNSTPNAPRNGVQAGSITSMAGPVSASGATECSMNYATTGLANQTFRLRFVVTSRTAIGATCP